MNNKGFSLIELVIAIAIVGILAVIGITQFSGITDKANIAVDEANAAEVASATKMYLALEPNADLTGINPKDLADEKLIDSSILEGDSIKARSNLYGASENTLMNIVYENDQILIMFGSKQAYPKLDEISVEE